MSKMILWTLAASLLVLLADAQVASQVKVTSPVLVSDTTTAEPIVDTDMTDKNDTQFGLVDATVEPTVVDVLPAVVVDALPSVKVDVPQAGVLPAVGVDVGPETGVAVKVAKNATEECCWMVTDYWPRKQCKEQCSELACGRGWGVYQSEEICCAPGVSFPDGCDEKLDECWVVESSELKTCMRDDRKCLQGYGVWGSKDACCAPNAAFPGGCGPDPVPVAKPCWVLDTYWPARLCRNSTTLCGADSGTPSWDTEEACCVAGAAFPNGCSAYAPQTPCWVVDSYFPERNCMEETDEAVCFRGWGVYQSEDICCAPNVAFPAGCSK